MYRIEVQSAVMSPPTVDIIFRWRQDAQNAPQDVKLQFCSNQQLSAIYFCGMIQCHLI